MLIATMLGADTPAAPHSSDHRQRQLPQRDRRHAAYVPHEQVRPRSAPSVGTRLANCSLPPSLLMRVSMRAFETMVLVSSHLKFSLVVTCLRACM